MAVPSSGSPPYGIFTKPEHDSSTCSKRVECGRCKSYQGQRALGCPIYDYWPKHNQQVCDDCMSRQQEYQDFSGAISEPCTICGRLTCLLASLTRGSQSCSNNHFEQSIPSSVSSRGPIRRYISFEECKGLEMKQFWWGLLTVRSQLDAFLGCPWVSIFFQNNADGCK